METLFVVDSDFWGYGKKWKPSKFSNVLSKSLAKKIELLIIINQIVPKIMAQ